MFIALFRGNQSTLINLASIIFSPSTPLHVKRQIRALLNISPARSMWKYLGVPLSAHSLNPSNCQYLVDRVTS